MTLPAESWQRVTPDVFAGLFPRESSPSLHPSTLRTLETIDSRHRPATREEYDEVLLHYFGLLHQDWIIRDTEQNHAAWLRGWMESLNEVLAHGPSAEACKPKYFRGSKFLRWKKGLVVSPNTQIEHDLFVAARQQLFQYWLRDFSSVHELGCGSCGNLWVLQDLFPDKAIRGYDWVEPSVKIAREIGLHTGRDVDGSLLNFLQPPDHLSLGSNAAVISIHALEQIGDRFGPLIDTLLRSNPALVVHYEPILEYYDNDNALDYLARWYSEKRKYLIGLPGYLHRLKNQGRIEILHEHRPELGGVLHEASVIVWRPL